MPKTPAKAASLSLTPPVPSDAPEITSLDEILAIDDYKIEPLYIPEWRCTVYVQTISGAMYDAAQQYAYQTDEKTGAVLPGAQERRRLAFVAAVLVNKQGMRLVEGPEAMTKLNGKNTNALQRIYEKGALVTVSTDEATDDLKNGSAGGRSSDASPPSASTANSPGSAIDRELLSV